MFSNFNIAGSLMRGSYAKQSPNHLNSHKNKMLGSLMGDYGVNQSPAISVEAPEFPFSSNLQFNIFAKVFFLNLHVTCRNAWPGGLIVGPQSSVLLYNHTLISSLGGELFSEEGTHSTCGWEQFEYQADCHQMSPSRNICKNLVGMVGTLDPAELYSSSNHSNLAWVQDVGCM